MPLKGDASAKKPAKGQIQSCWKERKGTIHLSDDKGVIHLPTRQTNNFFQKVNKIKMRFLPRPWVMLVWDGRNFFMYIGLNESFIRSLMVSVYNFSKVKACCFFF